jgi:hypothetical protein
MNFGRRLQMRQSREIAAASIIHGTLGFRASLEVTDHIRCVELCGRLLPWLEETRLGSLIEPFHREIFDTPYRKLPSDFQAEAIWRGDSAALLGWSIQLFDMPDPSESIDPGRLVTHLRILQPEAAELLVNASLRPRQDIERYCAYCVAVRNRFDLRSLGPDRRALFDGVYRQRLQKLGLDDESLQRDTFLEDASRFVSESPSARGLYVVRAIAAEWLLEASE